MTKGIINGQEVEITRNEKATHFYANGKRISRDVANRAIMEYVNFNNDQPKLRPNYVTIIEKAKEIKSVKEKISFLKANATTEEFKYLLELNKKEQISKGISYKRFARFLEVGILFSSRPQHLNLKKLKEFIADITKDGKRFELKTDEKVRLANIIPQDIEQVWLDAIGKNLKLGLSDKQIDMIIK